MRINQYKFPNRTLACYIEGKKKEGHDSCMVRGFWGDIVNSPYIGYGLELETREEVTYFYANNKIDYLRDSQDVTEYNLVKFLLRMDHNEIYDFMKREKEKERQRQERIKREEEEKEKKEKEEQEKKKKEQNKKLNSITEEQNEEEEEEICTSTKKLKEKEKEEKKDNKGIILDKNDGVKEMTEKISKLMTEEKKEKNNDNMNDTTEESMIKATKDENNYDTNELIQAFREVKFKIFLVGGDIEKNIYKKKKFKNYFDIILYGFHASSKFNEMQKSVLKPSSRLLFELNSYMASFEEKTRKEYKENLVKMCKNNGFILDDTSLKYLYQFKIKQPSQEDENQIESEENSNNTTEISTSTINKTNNE